ncbi:hypothetical protein TKK_0005419 [Trichogramma kaykai]|uniref:Allantoate amidinohydrolase n=1 Tax=Trichogramma kaykai TaxID=54128 RepID=A0ABD2XIS7_9HYME
MDGAKNESAEARESYKDVSSQKNGAKVLFATDDFFAVAENLLKEEEPEWNENYTEYGKWMDGWETRRKRIDGHDWAIIALSDPCELRSIHLDTAFFTGNFAPRFSVQAAHLVDDPKPIQDRRNKMGTAATDVELEKARELKSEDWDEIIPMTSLRSGHAETRKHVFEIANPRTYSHVRLNIYPDGGIARLRIFGSESTGRQLLLRSECVAFSNAHYGSPEVLLEASPSKGMHDGWETARKTERPWKIDLDDSGFIKAYGEEWAILRLETDVCIDDIQVDTTHFKGNCPDSVKIEAKLSNDEKLHSSDDSWITVLPKTKLVANRSNGLTSRNVVATKQPVNHIKVTIEPDGGLARIRIFGSKCRH